LTWNFTSGAVRKRVHYQHQNNQPGIFIIEQASYQTGPVKANATAGSYDRGIHMSRNLGKTKQLEMPTEKQVLLEIPAGRATSIANHHLL
jgi:hypothetical protein